MFNQTEVLNALEEKGVVQYALIQKGYYFDLYPTRKYLTALTFSNKSSNYT